MQQTELIAPCGMNCQLCTSYHTYLKCLSQGMKKPRGCSGCRIRDKKCSYIKKNCQEGLLLQKKVLFCFECPSYPCRNLSKLDERYRRNYQMSFLENLEIVKEYGAEELLNRHAEKYGCSRCGSIRSVHDGKCLNCLL